MDNMAKAILVNRDEEEGVRQFQQEALEVDTDMLHQEWCNEVAKEVLKSLGRRAQDEQLRDTYASTVVMLRPHQVLAWLQQDAGDVAAMNRFRTRAPRMPVSRRSLVHLIGRTFSEMFRDLRLELADAVILRHNGHCSTITL